MLRFLDWPFRFAAGKLGASADELKLVFSFLLSYPLAGLLKRVPDSRPDLKNLFSIGVSLFVLVGLFDLWEGLVTLFIGAAGSYCIAKFLRTSVYMPWIGFAYAMCQLSVSHIWRQLADDPSVVDITGAQMVMVMKLSAFCWNVADGQLPEEDLSDFQRQNRLPELPSLLDYAGYVLFFPSFMIGPSFDYMDYKRWLDGSMFELPAGIDPSKKPPVKKKRKIPRSGGPAIWRLFTGMFWVGLFMLLIPYFSYTVLLTDAYMKLNLPHRIFVLHMVNFVARLKYYGVWALTEGACILAGLGYNGVDPVTGKVSWNRLQNVDPWAVETAQNPRAYLGGWNINTNNWLRNYIYLRVTPRGKKPGFRASLMTFGTSALWHGFYPGYYLTFILASFIQTAAKNFRRHVRPFFLDPINGEPTAKKRYYDIATYFGTQLLFSFATTPFLVLSMSGSIHVWARVYFYAIVGTLGSLIFFGTSGKAILRKQLEKRNGKASAKLVRSVSTDSLSGGHPILGISKDPERDLDEAIKEIQAEIEAKKAEMEAKQAKAKAKTN